MTARTHRLSGLVILRPNFESQILASFVIPTIFLDK
ncbi:hypothetical protein CT19431_240064 [Cupriavidus taiwanensis]|nr:hypothetical protein CT19431_240064 [Cupriavidus taiwanensis]